MLCKVGNRSGDDECLRATFYVMTEQDRNLIAAQYHKSGFHFQYTMHCVLWVSLVNVTVGDVYLNVSIDPSLHRCKHCWTECTYSL